LKEGDGERGWESKSQNKEGVWMSKKVCVWFGRRMIESGSESESESEGGSACLMHPMRCLCDVVMLLVFTRAVLTLVWCACKWCVCVLH
jgi:hypothetical protein